jgi:starch synthase (maltosyl-transferring)
MICFSKRTTSPGQAGGESDGAKSRGHGSDTIIVVVNLDPHQAREATVWLDLPALGMEPGAEFAVTDELSGSTFRWGQANYVRLDPAVQPAHILTVTADRPAG